TYNVGWVERFVLPNSVLGFVPQTPLPTTERHLLQPSCSSATQWLGNRAAGVAPQPTIFR
ncbi:MAG: hypothetical protein AAFV71_12950, partial [Cyanobacteria bacterium J06633_8]